MTRQEAKQRWCPFARSLLGVWKSGINRHGDGEVHEGCRCIADGCLAWREWLTEPSSGHCGLAGDKGAA